MLQGIPERPNNDMSGDFGGQRKCLNSKQCSWIHSAAILDVWDVALSCWKYSSSWDCTMDMNVCMWSARMRTYVSPVRVVSRRIRSPISLIPQTPHTITESPPAWTCCWHAGPWIHEVASIPVHVHPPDKIGNETCQTKRHVSSRQQSNFGVQCS